MDKKKQGRETFPAIVLCFLVVGVLSLKSDACSGMISQMNTLSTTVNGFSSSINDHESRISELEASSGGLYKAASCGWIDLYMPSQSTGTFCRLNIHATDEDIITFYSDTNAIFLFYLSDYGFKFNGVETTITSASDGNITVTLGIAPGMGTAAGKISPIFLSGRRNVNFNLSNFSNGLYTITNISQK